MALGTRATGHPSLPIDRAYAKAAIALVVRASERLSREIDWDDYSENEITHGLSKEMIAVQRESGSDIPRFNFQCKHFADGDLTTVCEIDIKFEWQRYPNPSDYDRYLAVEAKKVRAAGASLAGPYVVEGVMDFVNCKYGRKHELGVMLAYVVNGPCDQAVGHVASAMESRRALTFEVSAFSPNTGVCAHARTHHSSHLQPTVSSTITLVHLFIDLARSPNTQN